MTNWRYLLRVVALICFVLEVVGVPTRVNLLALGLACWVGSTL